MKIRSLISALLVSLLILSASGCNESASNVSSEINSADLSVTSTFAESSKATVADVSSDISSKTNKLESADKQNVASEKKNVSSNKEPTEFEKMLSGTDKAMSFSGRVFNDSYARITSLMRRAAKGGDYTIAVLGGSISKGRGASSPDKSYINLVVDWWEKTFPKSNFKLVNISMDNSNPEVACFQFSSEVQKYSPDLVIVDYALDLCRDKDDIEDTLATLYYKVLNSSTLSAVMTVYFTDSEKVTSKDFPNSEVISAANQYKIPEINYHEYIKEKIENKVISWDDVGADSNYPNDNGHKIAANLIIKFFEHARKKINEVSIDKAVVPDKPLHRSVYIDTLYFTNTSHYVKSEGFIKMANNSPETRGWKYDPNNECKLTVTVPSDKKIHIMIAFDNKAVGSVSMNGVTADGQYIYSFANPGRFDGIEVIALRGFVNEVTITADMKSGGFTIYGIGTSKSNSY